MNQSDLLLELLKKQVISYAASSALKTSVGWKYKVLSHVLEYIFDKWITPVIKWSSNEAIININVWEVKRELKAYENAETRDERIRRFNALS